MHRETLDNGLTLLVDATGDADVAAIYAWVRAGSSVEPPGLEGAAHVLEHMVFKGTRSWGVGGVAAAIEGMGGDLNAFTSFDDTAFHCTVPAARAPEALSVLAEMLLHATLDPVELERERQVILEEIRGGEDDPDLVLGEATWASAFPGHPYGRSIIGTVASVRGIARDDLLAFYRRWYRPSNTVVSVAGPVDARAVRDAVLHAFGSDGPDTPEAPARRPLRASTPGPTVLRRGFEATMVDLAFPVATGTTLADEAALDVLALALAGGRSAPMERRLRRDERLCQSVSASLDLERDGGLFTIALHAHEGRATDAVRAAREELARAHAGELPAQDVERARAAILASMAVRRESADARASDMANDMVRHGDPDAWKAYEYAVRSLRPADVHAAAARVLDDGAEIAVALVPARVKVDLSRGPAPERARSGAGSRGSVDRAVSRVTLDNGLRILLEPGDGEAVAVRLTGLGGMLVEPRGGSGRTLAWSRALTRGCAGLDAHAFACEVEGLGAGIAGTTGRSTQAVRGDFTRGNLAGGLELFADAVLRPDFDAGEWAMLRDELLATLEEKADDPELLASERLWALVYGTHPYGAPATGTPGTLARMTAGHLRAHHARWARPDNLVLSVAGGFDPDSMLRRIRRLFGSMAPAPRPAPERDAPHVAAPTRRVRLRSDREQAHVLAAWAGERVDGPDQPALELLSAILGGQGGRLFMELREAHGLAYSVGAASHEGWAPGLLVASIATDPARLDEAERGLIRCVGALAEAPVEAAELERARTALLGTAEAELQSAAFRAASMGLVECYGSDGATYRTLLRRRVGSLAPETLLATARRRLAAPLAVVRVEATGDA
jgi:zinc protease